VVVADLKLSRHLKQTKLEAILIPLSLKLTADEISLEVDDNETNGYTSRENADCAVR